MGGSWEEVVEGGRRGVVEVVERRCGRDKTRRLGRGARDGARLWLLLGWRGPVATCHPGGGESRGPEERPLGGEEGEGGGGRGRVLAWGGGEGFTSW